MSIRKEKKEPLPVGIGQTVQEFINNLSVSEEKEIRKAEMSLAEEVERVRSLFPDKYEGYGVPEASKVRNPDKYGLRRVKEIDRALKRNRAPRKRKGNTVHTMSWRITKELRDHLQIEFEDCGCYSFQDGLDYVMIHWLAERRRSRE